MSPRRKGKVPKGQGHEIWIDLYPLTRFLAKYTQPAVKVEGTKEWVRTTNMMRLLVVMAALPPDFLFWQRIFYAYGQSFGDTPWQDIFKNDR